MKIFVTGATGVIGRRVVPLLVGAGHRVSAVARTPEQAAALTAAGATAVQVDLFTAPEVRAALRGHDAVVNLATHMPASSMRMFLPWAWRENDRIRKVASAILAAAAADAGVGRFIQESFAVYPDCGDAWIHESVPIAPARYNRTVADAELAALRFGARGGVGIVLRFAGFYGSDSSHLRDMVNLVRKGWAPLPGSPDAFYSSVSHDDAASAVVAALGARAGIYNVADDEPLRRREYADSLAAALGVAPPRFLPGWVTRVSGSLVELMSRSQRMLNVDLRCATGWAPRYPSVRAGWHAALSAHRLAAVAPRRSIEEARVRGARPGI